MHQASSYPAATIWYAEHTIHDGSIADEPLNSKRLMRPGTSAGRDRLLVSAWAAAWEGRGVDTMWSKLSSHDDGKSYTSDLLDGVLGHLETVTKLLQSSLSPATRNHLCTIAGETAQIAGQIYFDIHHYDTALLYYHVSLDAAQEANNHPLQAAGLGRMSFLQTYNGHPEEALPFIQEAQHLALQSATITTRSWLAAVEAEAYANLGVSFACFNALERAEQVIDQAYGTPEEDPYRIGFNPSRLAGYKGVCYVRLHQPDDAQKALHDALALIHPLPMRRKSTILTDLAATYIQQGEIEKACQLAHQALDITAQTKSVTVLLRIRNLRRELEPWKATQSVRNLDQHIVSLLVRLTGRGNV